MHRRRVHYFSGFDPRGPAHYHRLFREQAERPQPGGGHLSVSPRHRAGAHIHRWQVDWQPDPDADDPGSPVRTEHVFMGWDDLIRRHWSRSPLALAREFVRVHAAMLGHVGLGRVRRLYPNAFLTAILPAGWLGASLLLGALAAVGAHAWLAAPLAAALGAGVVAGLGALGAHAGLFWLLRIYHFILCMAQDRVAGLDSRAHDWVEDIIRRQQDDPVDEVVLAGHSVGTLVMIDAVDRLLADPRWQALQRGRRTGMLTLGQCYPCLTLLPGAAAFRQALQRLSRHPDLRWLDVTALIDPMCFYRTPPLAGTPEAADCGPQPVQLAARFFHMYEPRRWARIRRDKLQAHFLYLMTPDRAGNFDLFAMLYGPQPFEQQLVAARLAAAR